MTNAEPVIQLSNVAVQFDEVSVHRDINLQIYRGEIVTLIGPSGAGKTVILKLIIGLLRPHQGKVVVFGRNISLLNEAGLLPIRRRIGMLFQGAALFDSLTVFENIAYPLREQGDHSEAEMAATVSEKLSIVGLPEAGKKYPSELSGGQKKRVGLARALASSPEVILFDEPTTGLDPTNVRRIDNLLIRLRDEYGITSVVVTHDIQSAQRISDRWILINNGVVEAAGAAAEVRQNHQRVHDFVTGHWDSAL